MLGGKTGSTVARPWQPHGRILWGGPSLLDGSYVDAGRGERVGGKRPQAFSAISCAKLRQFSLRVAARGVPSGRVA